MRIVSLSSSARRVEPKETLERNILSKIDVVPYVDSLKHLQRFDSELSQRHIYKQIALRDIRVFVHFPPLSISEYLLLRLYLNHAPFQQFAKIVVYINETKRTSALCIDEARSVARRRVVCCTREACFVCVHVRRSTAPLFLSPHVLLDPRLAPRSR